MSHSIPVTSLKKGDAFYNPDGKRAWTVTETAETAQTLNGPAHKIVVQHHPDGGISPRYFDPGHELPLDGDAGRVVLVDRAH